MKQGTGDRENKLNILKRNLAWACCADLLSPPLPTLEPLRFSNQDTDEEKQLKRSEHQARSEAREKERIMREPELIYELDKIIERVKLARLEYENNSVNYRVLSEAYREFKFTCERCKNQVRHHDH
jgi:hypothetical protein